MNGRETVWHAIVWRTAARVALVRALVTVAVLLLDEPLGALDLTAQATAGRVLNINAGWHHLLPRSQTRKSHVDVGPDAVCAMGNVAQFAAFRIYTIHEQFRRRLHR